MTRLLFEVCRLAAMPEWDRMHCRHVVLQLNVSGLRVLFAVMRAEPARGC
jgi:hypothetical protein